MRQRIQTVRINGRPERDLKGSTMRKGSVCTASVFPLRGGHPARHTKGQKSSLFIREAEMDAYTSSRADKERTGCVCGKVKCDETI